MNRWPAEPNRAAVIFVTYVTNLHKFPTFHDKPMTIDFAVFLE